MDLLAYWRWDNFLSDLDEGAGFNFNSNQPRLHSAIDVGESLWLVTGRPSPHGTAYVLAARLVITAKTHNAAGYRYGRFRLWGDLAKSRYFTHQGPDASALLRGLRFDADRPIAAAHIGQALQTLRALSSADARCLEAWASALTDEPRAYALVDEMALEETLRERPPELGPMLTRTHRGVSDATRARLTSAVSRNRDLVLELRALYQGRCQLCAFDPGTLYAVDLCEAHHIVYLSRGGEDALANMMLLCPNHHSTVHATGAIFDHAGLSYIFPKGRRDPLVLNKHLTAA
ncbi:MAG: HNH endonuclease [Myxococcales bacterium]|nr:HNH endonuclease [Myxococcales bacterium]